MGVLPDTAAPLAQKSVRVTPTRSIYTFAGAGIELELTFLTPALPQDIDLLSRPITYMTYRVQATDGQQHDVSIYLAASADICVDTPDQHVNATKESIGEITVARLGSVDQKVLARKGDDLRIDWGYFYVAARQEIVSTLSLGSFDQLRTAFAAGELKGDPSAPIEDQPAADVAAVLTFDVKGVGRGTSVTLAGVGLRRFVLDRVHALKTATLLAARRPRRSRVDYRSGARLCSSH